MKIETRRVGKCCIRVSFTRFAGNCQANPKTALQHKVCATNESYSRVENVSIDETIARSAIEIKTISEFSSPPFWSFEILLRNKKKIRRFRNYVDRNVPFDLRPVLPQIRYATKRFSFHFRHLFPINFVRLPSLASLLHTHTYICIIISP